MKLKKIYILFILPLILIHPVYGEDPKSAETANPASLSLTLNEAIALALKQNTTIIGSGFSIQGAVVIKSSAEADFDLTVSPTVNAGITSYENSGVGIQLSKKFLTGTTVTVTHGFNKDIIGYNTTINTTITQPLFKGLGVFYNSDNINASDYSLRTSRLQMYQKKSDIALDTIKTAYSAERYKETIELYKSLINRLNGYIKTAKIKEEVGLATPMDVYRAEISQKQISGSLSEEQELYENAVNKLKVNLALPLTIKLEIKTPMEINPFILTEQEAINSALIYNITLKQAAIDIDEAKRKAEIAKMNIMPDVSLAVNYNRTLYLDNANEGISPQYYGIMITSSTDISRRKEKTAYQLSLMKIASLNLDLTSKRDELIRQVMQQRFALKKAQEQMQIKTELIKQARGKQLLARSKYDHEMADNFDLITAETELNFAQQGLLEAQINYISALYDMRAILGTLIEYKDE